MIVWITAMKNKIAQNLHAVPTNSNVNLVVVYPQTLDVIKRTIAEIIQMSLNVATSLVQHHNLHAPTDGVFQICGSVRIYSNSFYVREIN